MIELIITLTGRGYLPRASFERCSPSPPFASGGLDLGELFRL